MISVDNPVDNVDISTISIFMHTLPHLHAKRRDLPCIQYTVYA